MRNPQKTVTAPGWNVSTTTGSGIQGAILSVFKMRGEKFQRGDADKRQFPTREAAWAFALEHGYTQAFVTPWCPWCRVQHSFIGRKSGWCDRKNQFVTGKEN